MNSPAGSASAEAVDATGYDMDALRLLRRVRVCRELRLLWRLALLALPLWVAAMASLQATAPDGAHIQDVVDDIALPGLAWIAIVAGVGLAAQAVAMSIGSVGRIAGRLVPLIGLGWQPEPPHGPQSVRAFVSRLGRRGWVSFGALVLVLAFVPLTGVVAFDFVQAARANHGKGGRVVTIGDDASIAYSELSAKGNRSYYLDTPDGFAIAEDSRPEKGQRWTVVDNPFGDDMAYRVGAHDYVLLLFVTMGIGAIALGSAGFAYGQVRRERRRRRSEDHAPLAETVRQLAGGERIALRLSVRQSDSVLAPRLVRKTPDPIEVRLGLPPLAPGRTATALLLRRRLLAGATAVVVVGATGTALVLWRDGAFRAPPVQRDVTLSYLHGTGWQPNASADYSTQPEARSLAQDALAAGGADQPHVTAFWSLLIDSTNLRTRFGTASYVSVDVVGIGSVTPQRAVAGAVDVVRSVAGKTRTTALAGLPAGWRGVATAAHDADGVVLDAAGAEHGYLVQLELRLDTVVPAATAVQRASADLRALAAALARRGLDGFAQDTAQR